MIHQRAREKFQALDHPALGINITDLRGELRQLLRTYPDFPPALQRFAVLQEQAGEFSDALRSLQRAVALNPRDVTSWVRLARLHYERLREPDHALRALSRALEIEANHPEALALRRQIENGKQSGNPAPAEAGVPLISAIVSTFKSERFMRGCLEDLERQTIAGQMEIIVVDSASPQNERAIVEEFQKRFSNITYIRTDERETVYGAWNRGVKAARGRYVTNANTDDRHRSDAFEILVRALEHNPEVSLAYADCLITKIENETFESTHATRKYQWLDFDKTSLLTKGCFVGPQPVWRREVHDEHGYFDAEFVASGDYEFWLRLARTRKFLHVRETLGLYLESPASVEHSNGPRGEWESWEARRRHAANLLPGYQIENPPRFVPPRSTAPAAPAPTKAAPAPLPPVALLGQLGDARELLAQKNLAAAWEAAGAAIRLRPFHPEAFLLLAEIALAAGASASARRCAEHAAELAPGWSAPKKFLKKPFKGNAQPDWLKLPPALDPQLTVCVIAKNEEKFLAQCLRSIQPLAQQIVVVDTGSTDRTAEIAREFGAEVRDFAWCDDFSAARNAALERATGDWILMLDADEELPADQHAKLLAEIKNSTAIGFRLPLVNHGQEADGPSFVPRLFRNAPGVHFHGRIHEQVFPSLVALGKNWVLGTALGTAQILHHGYTPEMVRDRNKIERNLKLLRQAVAENPGDANLAMNLGMELVRSGDVQAGLTHYREALRLMSAQPAAEVVPELREVLLTQLTSHLYKIRAHDEVVRILNSPLATNGGLTASLHFALGLSQFELKNFRAAADNMRQCLTKRRQPSLAPINTDVLGAAPRHCLALSLARAGDAAGAETAFQESVVEAVCTAELRVDYAKFLVGQHRAVEALQRLHEVVQATPQHAGAWKFGGEIALRQPEFLEFAGDWTGEAIRSLPRDAVIVAQRAEALLLAGQTETARLLWEQVFHGEHSPRAHAALLICAVVEAQPAQAPENNVEEIAATRAFTEWYGRLLKAGAQGVIAQLNERVEALREKLPSAARLLETALAEAGAPELAATT